MEKIGSPYLEQTYNKMTGQPCVKLYQLVELSDGRQTKRQMGQWPTLEEAKRYNPGVEVKS